MNDTRHRPYVDRRPPAPHDHRPQLAVTAIAAATALVVVFVLFWNLAMPRERVAQAPTPPVETAAPAEPTANPAPAAPAPAPAPAPAEEAPPPPPPSSVLSSDDWLLSPYAVLNRDNTVEIVGTLLNRSAEPRSAVIQVYVYVDNAVVATGTTEVRDLPGGGTVEVELQTGSPWVGGNKVLYVRATPAP